MRFLQSLGFAVIGVDISAEMIARARLRDPGGDYRVIEDGDFNWLSKGGFDLIQSAFTFDNVPGFHRKVRLFRGLGELLDGEGTLVNIVSTSEMYTDERVNFSTQDYPENRAARCGEVVRIITTEYSDERPVDDVFWPHEDYLRVYREAGLDLFRVERPLAVGDEGIAWKSELDVEPWAIYMLRRIVG